MAGAVLVGDQIVDVDGQSVRDLDKKTIAAVLRAATTHAPHFILTIAANTRTFSEACSECARTACACRG